MKKFMIIASVLVIGWFIWDYLYFYTGILYIPHTGDPTYFSKAENGQLYLDQGNGYEVFEIRGVNLGLSKPGHYASDNAVTKEDYLRWFRQIKELGANVIRIYSLGGDEFYEAFYEYNQNNPDPLYLLQGVQVDDYLVNSVYSALDREFREPFWKNCRTVVDAVHGRLKINTEAAIFPVHYRWDVSPWVCGYILGSEWESTLVSYTDYSHAQLPQFEGTYFRTENASNFEIFLAETAEEVVSYETRKYGTQRLLAFSNWAITDPLDHPESVVQYFEKAASIDVEHIKCTEQFGPGQFASYHVYPYYPDYFSLLPEHEENTYLQYLTAINEHHSIPVVISEFGVPSSRGMAVRDEAGRNQGYLSETSQGEMLVSMYRDIQNSGCAGAIVFNWQDEWNKQSWNTMSAINLNNSIYWNDVQTTMQHYGLLSFDPGSEHSTCYVDGDRSDWSGQVPISNSGGIRLSVKYDVKYIYFLVEKDSLSLETDHFFIPIDTTPKSGSTFAENLDLSMNCAADFIIEIDGSDNSRLWVHERYNLTGALYYDKITSQNIFSKIFPSKDSANFTEIRMLLQNALYYRKIPNGGPEIPLTFDEYDELDPNAYQVQETYETGKLLYGNANPASENFNSLADFCAGDGFIEIRIPWGLLNFYDPSEMEIHNDYYECYGVEALRIESMNVGAGDGSEPIRMFSVALEKLDKKPAYHERLKESYYLLQNEWTK